MTTTAIKQAFQEAVKEAYTSCKRMSSVDQHIRDAMYDRGYEMIDEYKSNNPENYEPIEIEDDGQPDAMQEWHDFDPEC